MNLARAVLACRSWLALAGRGAPKPEQATAYAAAVEALASCPEDSTLVQFAAAEAAQDLPHLPPGMSAGPRMIPLAALPPYAQAAILGLWPALDPRQTVVVVDPERLVVAGSPASPSIPDLPALRFP